MANTKMMTEETFQIDQKHFDAISDVAIIAMTNASGQIVFVNDRFCEVSGYSRNELLGKDHRILNSGFHSKKFFRDMYQIIKDGKIWRSEIRNRNKKGEYYWVDTKIIPIFDLYGKIESYLTVRFDITERKSLEQSVTHLEKLATLGKIAASVAHEINNPLTIIDLSLKNLERELESLRVSDTNLKNRIEKIKNSSNRITKIVKGLKTISKKNEDVSFQKVEANLFLEEVLYFCIEQRKDVAIDIKNSTLAFVNICTEQVSQIIINLFNNAMDAIDLIEEKWIKIELVKDENKKTIEIRIRNSGPRIEESVADKIMEPFFTTKTGKGTGLGLSISKKIAEEHKGNLFLDLNEPSTTFVLVLPLFS